MPGLLGRKLLHYEDIKFTRLGWDVDVNMSVGVCMDVCGVLIRVYNCCENRWVAQEESIPVNIIFFCYPTLTILIYIE